MIKRFFLLLILLTYFVGFAQVPDNANFSAVFGTDGANGFTDPTGFYEIPNVPDNYLVTEKGGTIHLLASGAGGNYSKTQFYQTAVSNGNHEGLLSLAFHPNYAINRKYYICYSPVMAVPRTFVEERTAGADFKSDAGGQGKVIISLDQPSTRHNFGNIAFDKAGLLYIGSGNGGIADDDNTNGQNKDNLFSAILRIDVDNPGSTSAYSIPATNPFANGGGAPEIFAYGLRNPWRFSFDRLTGDLWVGDVGSDIAEEISIVKVGENMGWKTVEGDKCYSLGCSMAGTVMPVYAFPNHTEARAIMGGYVFRANSTSPYYGVYVFGDFRAGGIWGMKQENGSMTELKKWGTLSGMAGFSEDVEGNIYIVGHNDGTIYKIDLGEPTPVASNSIKHDYQLSSNLIGSTLILNLNEKQLAKVMISDINGKRIFSNSNIFLNNYPVNLNESTSGVYTLQVEVEDEVLFKKIILK